MWDGEEVHLTPIEYKLLCLLAHNVGKVLTHNMILKEIWGNVLPSDTPSLRVFMATLRKKIEQVPSQPKYIQTHVGVGYRDAPHREQPGGRRLTARDRKARRCKRSGGPSVFIQY